MATRRPSINVRRAEARDAEAIQATMAAPRAMAGTLQLPFPTADMWRKRIADIAVDDYLLVAEVAGEVVGNLGLHAAGRARRRHAGTIGMAVRDDWQRRGVGTALMAVAINIADNWLNYRRLELTVYTDNVAALTLYRKFGFELEGTHKDYAFRDGRYIDAHAVARVRQGVVGGKALTRPSTTKSAKSTKKGPEAHRKGTKTARKRKSS